MSVVGPSVVLSRPLLLETVVLELETVVLEAAMLESVVLVGTEGKKIVRHLISIA